MAEGRNRTEETAPPPARRSFTRALLPWILIVIAVALGFAWSQRSEIADDLIAAELEKRGLPVTYEVEHIGGRRQVFSDIVIGNADRPDATVERAEIRIGWSLLGPAVESVTLISPRLYGTYRDGELSFGSLNPLLFEETEDDEPPSLPDLEVRLVDGRARIASDYGVLGLALNGEGNLSDRFDGTLGALVPNARFDGCEASRASLYGDLTISDGAPSIAGPLRLRDLECAGQGVSLATLDAGLTLVLPASLDAAEGSAAIDAGALGYGELAAQGLTGDIQFDLGGGDATLGYDLALVGLDTPQADLARVASDGIVRLRDDFARLEWSGDFDGRNLRPGTAFARVLTSIGEGGADTPFAPLALKLRSALAQQAPGSSVAGSFTVRRDDGPLRVLAPELRWSNRGGALLAEVDRLRWSDGNIAGSFRTGGPGLPNIRGSIDRSGTGATLWRIAMQEYAAGDARLVLPELTVRQAANGSFSAQGDVRLSGPLPGGEARNLAFPIDATYTPSGGFAAFTRCTQFSFERFVYANLQLEQQGVTLCPPSSGAIVRGGAGPLRIAAGAPSLELSGMLGGTAIDISSGPVGFAYPGVVRASQLAVHLGPPDSGADFLLTDLDAELGGSEIAGTFGDTEARLAAVPLDVRNAAGSWRYADGALILSRGNFVLSDRGDPQRFYPLDATEARLTLEDGEITAAANLRDRDTGQIVTAVDVFHDLSSGNGNAELVTDGLAIGPELRLDDLTYLTAGRIADTQGVIDGVGRIAWRDGEVTSSGEYSSNDFDFSAPFGPVEGASGTLVFTDLLGFETAPSQTFQVRSINPGILVEDGEITLSLREGFEIGIEGGSWPFLGGTLTLNPTQVRFGEGEVRRFTLVVRGLEAARFVERFELGNISATGTFDGEIPLVFDDAGGRIVGGTLLSRPPGGNISYVGELTYEDLSTMGNFAFNMLRSVDFTQMSIAMDGELTGNIVTRVKTAGVRQGVEAERNILTRSLEGLPIQLNINIDAQFYTLITLLKSLYDPTALRSAESVGLIDEQGNIIGREVRNPPPEEIEPEEIVPDDIQPPESENRP